MSAINTSGKRRGLNSIVGGLRSCKMGNNTSKEPTAVENRTPEQKEVIEDESETKAEDEHRQISVLIVGAGMRGQTYTTYSKDFPNRMKVVGVAEPVFQRRSMMQNVYKIEKENVFDDWKDVSVEFFVL